MVMVFIGNKFYNDGKMKLPVMYKGQNLSTDTLLTLSEPDQVTIEGKSWDKEILVTIKHKH